MHSGEERCSGRLENGARVYIFRFRVRHVFTVRGGWRETEHGNPSRGSDKWRARLFALSRFLSVLLSNDGRRRVFYGNNVVVWLGRGRVERLVYFERRCRRSTRAPTSSRRRFFVCVARAHRRFAERRRRPILRRGEGARESFGKTSARVFVVRALYAAARSGSIYYYYYYYCVVVVVAYSAVSSPLRIIIIS